MREMGQGRIITPQSPVKTKAEGRRQEAEGGKSHPQGGATAVDGFPGIKEAVRCGGSPRCSNCRQVASGLEPNKHFSSLLPSALCLSSSTLTTPNAQCPMPHPQ